MQSAKHKKTKMTSMKNRKNDHNDHKVCLVGVQEPTEGRIYGTSEFSAVHY